MKKKQYFYSLLAISFFGLIGCKSTEDLTGSTNDLLKKDILSSTAEDPFEPWNRYVFAFNDTVDDVALEPVSIAYKHTVPSVFKIVVKNELDYLQMPVTMVNSVLQGDISLILNSFGRFFVNTTLGGFGLLDPASEFGLKRHYEDFGQTLAVWGVPSGGYYVAPFLGALTLRDFGAKLVDVSFSPWTYAGDATLAVQPTVISLGVIDFRADNDDIIKGIKQSSIDYYATVRSLYLQKREGEINNSDLKTEDKKKPQFIDFNQE